LKTTDLPKSNDSQAKKGLGQIFYPVSIEIMNELESDKCIVNRDDKYPDELSAKLASINEVNKVTS
jgi:hypothetical protein